MGDLAGDRLEGWLEDSPIDDFREDFRSETMRSSPETDEPEVMSGPEVWDDDSWEDTPSRRRNEDEDPWV
jgi:hypothetical protein